MFELKRKAEEGTQSSKTKSATSAKTDKELDDYKTVQKVDS